MQMAVFVTTKALAFGAWCASASLPTRPPSNHIGDAVVLSQSLASPERRKYASLPMKSKGVKNMMADRDNDVTEVAKQFNVHRSTLYRRAKKA